MGSIHISNIKISSVVPATMTSENKAHELTNMDLVMKLHYIHGVYFFSSEAVQGLTIYDLKEPMFLCLDLYLTTSGRVRRSETSRPFIKCNDSGVRIVEAKCDKTIEEFLAMKDHPFHDNLAYNQALGPDLSISPLVFIQEMIIEHIVFVNMSCVDNFLDLGKILTTIFMWLAISSLGSNVEECVWDSGAHVLGDAFSASAFVNMFGQIASGHKLPKYLHVPNPGKSKFPPSTRKEANSIKSVDRLGDCWLIPSNSKMDTEYEYPTNGMVLSMVEADLSGVKADLSQVVELLAEKRVNENNVIEEMMEKENGEADYIVYGANLTLLNLEEAKIYDLELKGHRPIFANYAINGVGDEGVVLVLPGAGGTGNGLTVTMVLPENELALLKSKFERDWNIV
uniref:Uncharacterized protein n=1 Tax=Fagus sylvatica TaxID=28930 RepID=A0A2N9FL31_FAGSY